VLPAFAALTETSEQAQTTTAITRPTTTTTTTATATTTATTTTTTTSTITGAPFLIYTPETGVAGGGIGFLFFKTGDTEDDRRRSSLTLALLVSERGQYQVGFFPDLWAFGDAFEFSGNYRLARYPLFFYGIGPGARQSDEEEYSQDYFHAKTELRVRLMRELRALYVGFAHDLDVSRIRQANPGPIADGTVLGADGGVTAGVGPEIVYDSRDDLNYPREGVFTQASYISYGAGLGSDYSFSQLIVDARAYRGIGARHTFAAQLYASLGSGGAPFYMLSQLGGTNLLRGFYMGRFRDNSMAIAQVEYRALIWWRLGGALFFGVGETAHRLSDFTAEPHVKPAGGAGIRFVLSEKEKLTLRFDVGVSETGVLPYALAQEAF
jgi:hypothetical protein